MTTNNTNPSNPREDELREGLAALVLDFTPEYIHGYENSKSQGLNLDYCTFDTVSGFLDGLEEFIKAREATMQAEKVEKNKSYCGCIMCLHHTEAYAISVGRAAQTNGEGDTSHT